MTNLLSLIFDAGLAVLLVITIGYCKGLSRRIRLLQDSRGELAGMITQFDQATSRAMTSLAELQTVSKRITDALQLKIEKANFLADDLAFLIEKSSKLATQLEQARAAVKPEAPKPKPTAEALPYTQNVSTITTKPKLGIWPPPQAPVTESSSATSVASLEALLNSLAAPAAGASPATTRPSIPKPQPPQGPRTDAERELLEALKSGR